MIVAASTSTNTIWGTVKVRGGTNRGDQGNVITRLETSGGGGVTLGVTEWTSDAIPLLGFMGTKKVLRNDYGQSVDVVSCYKIQIRTKAF